MPIRRIRILMRVRIRTGEASRLIFDVQVCHHYLVPLLSQIPLDSSLFKRDTSYSSMAPPDSHEEGGEGLKGSSCCGDP